MPTLQDLQAQDAAYAKAGNDAQTAEQAKQTLGSTGQPNGILSWMTQMPRRITSGMIDSAVHAADSMTHDGSWGEAAARVGRDVAAGAADAVVNTGDAAEGLLRNGARAEYESVVHPQQAALEAEDPAMLARDQQMDGSAQRSPIWDHARNAILDFRDAVAVKDPNLVDGLTQSVAQLAIPFAGYSKALSGVHDAAIAAQGLEDISATQGFGSYLMKTAQKDLTGLATKVVAPGAMTDATALQPHSMRFADLIALGRHTEGKLGDVLQALAPDGSAMDSYIRYLTDRGDEGEAEGRWKNVLDGFGVNLLATPLITAVGSVLKQGTAGLRYLVDNGVASGADFPRPPAATQAGKIVFHGTPHDFDEFDSSKIGTGEGNQTFGHGLYFAENPATAEHYQGMLSRQMGLGNPEAQDAALKAILQAGGNRARAFKSLMDSAANEPNVYLRNKIQTAAALIKQGNEARGAGRVMHVDIPDEHINKMVDWDQPVAAQPEFQKALADLNVKVVPENGRFRVMVDGKPGPQYLTRQAAMSETDLLRGESHSTNAGMAYNQLAEALRSPKAASEYLESKGIPGIKYLDQGSRGAGEGTRNVVLFNAKHARIVEKH